MSDGVSLELESESIEIIREVAATAAKPVMLYSIGKDSSVMLRLAQKAFYPGPIPFPLLHIDTGWKFREMIAFRDRTAREIGFELITYTNPRGAAEGHRADYPWFGVSYRRHENRSAAAKRSTVMALTWRSAAPGATRKNRAPRSGYFRFARRAIAGSPKPSAPSCGILYNTRINPGETIRVFPISNWTEADIWAYIRQENIPIVPLYFAAERPVVKRYGQWIMVDDHRLPLEPGETPEWRRVRFRTLGCYPLTAAVESPATTLDEIVAETLGATTSERQGRIIDHDGAGSMERKKQEGYF